MHQEIEWIHAWFRVHRHHLHQSHENVETTQKIRSTEIVWMKRNSDITTSASEFNTIPVYHKGKKTQKVPKWMLLQYGTNFKKKTNCTHNNNHKRALDRVNCKLHGFPVANRPSRSHDIKMLFILFHMSCHYFPPSVLHRFPSSIKEQGAIDDKVHDWEAG